MRTREATIAVAARLFDTDGYGPVAKAGAGAAVAGFVLGTLIGWLFFPDAMKPWQFGMIFALVTLLLVLLAATPYVWRRYSGQS